MGMSQNIKSTIAAYERYPLQIDLEMKIKKVTSVFCVAPLALFGSFGYQVKNGFAP